MPYAIEDAKKLDYSYIGDNVKQYSCSGKDFDCFLNY